MVLSQAIPYLLPFLYVIRESVDKIKKGQWKSHQLLSE